MRCAHSDKLPVDDAQIDAENSLKEGDIKRVVDKCMGQH